MVYGARGLNLALSRFVYMPCGFGFVRNTNTHDGNQTIRNRQSDAVRHHLMAQKARWKSKCVFTISNVFLGLSYYYDKLKWALKLVYI